MAQILKPWKAILLRTKLTLEIVKFNPVSYSQVSFYVSISQTCRSEDNSPSRRHNEPFLLSFQGMCWAKQKLIKWNNFLRLLRVTLMKFQLIFKCKWVRRCTIGFYIRKELECHRRDSPWLVISSFQKSAFNCDISLTNSHWLFTGTPEMAFVHALAAASTASFIARACRDGQLASCGCSRSARPNQLHEDWTWGGCGDDMEFGYKWVCLASGH